MATLFFKTAFQNEVAERVMAGIIAISIFGNLFITTFTAGKGEREDRKPDLVRTAADSIFCVSSQAGNCERGNIAVFALLR